MIKIRTTIVLLLNLFGLAAFGQQRFLPVSALNAHKDKAFSAFFQLTNHWSAGDVGTSVPLSDGRVLWFFGDCYIDQFDPASGTVPGLFSARNSVLVQDTNDLMHPLTLANFKAQDKSFFHPPDAGNKFFWPCFWPAAGFQNGNRIYVYLGEMQKTSDDSMWGFKVAGHSWAIMSFPELKVLSYVKLPDYNGIQFACGFIQEEGSAFTYAYGNKNHGIGCDVYLARFPTDTPETGWSFWDGREWSDDVSKAKVIAVGASASVNVCKVKNKIVMVTTDFSVACDQGKNIYVMTSDLLAGPFTKAKKIYSLDDRVNGHSPFFYCAVPHPEFIDANGLLITYCINGYAPCVPTVVKGRMNPDYYRPRAIRLPLW